VEFGVHSPIHLPHLPSLVSSKARPRRDKCTHSKQDETFDGEPVLADFPHSPPLSPTPVIRSRPPLNQDQTPNTNKRALLLQSFHNLLFIYNQIQRIALVRCTMASIKLASAWYPRRHPYLEERMDSCGVRPAACDVRSAPVRICAMSLLSPTNPRHSAR
jgi:hypothetical protein